MRKQMEFEAVGKVVEAKGKEDIKVKIEKEEEVTAVDEVEMEEVEEKEW